MSWVSTTPASTSALLTIKREARDPGTVMPLRLEGVMNMAWPALEYSMSASHMLVE